MRSPSAATVATVAEFHTPGYVGGLDDDAREAGLLAVGAVQHLCRAVVAGDLANGYALVRPAGHHATASAGGGGCVFANAVLAAYELRRLGLQRILIIDWDAHHGNGQQDAFWTDGEVLTISIHQAREFAPGTGGTDARGSSDGYGCTINVPVPPGSGGGVYRAVFSEVIGPAAARFRPDAIVVASGVDANYIDPSARLCLHSGDYGWLASSTRDLAEKWSRGRLVMTHEGGYALSYLPFCFLRIIEAMAGAPTMAADPFLARWGETFADQVSAEARRVIDECAILAASVPT